MPISITAWSKEFLEAGNKRLLGDTRREATSDELMCFLNQIASCSKGCDDGHLPKSASLLN